VEHWQRRIYPQEIWIVSVIVFIAACTTCWGTA
jgi:hypothetical protein